MTGRQIITDAQNTWYPGCGNFSIQHTLKNVLIEMEQAGKSLDDVVLVSGIGCHAKIADYLNINRFYALHGRAIPAATGIKLGNPRLGSSEVSISLVVSASDADAAVRALHELILARTSS